MLLLLACAEAPRPVRPEPAPVQAPPMGEAWLVLSAPLDEETARKFAKEELAAGRGHAGYPRVVSGAEVAGLDPSAWYVVLAAPASEEVARAALPASWRKGSVVQAAWPGPEDVGVVIVQGPIDSLPTPDDIELVLLARSDDGLDPENGVVARRPYSDLWTTIYYPRAAASTFGVAAHWIDTEHVRHVWCLLEGDAGAPVAVLRKPRWWCSGRVVRSGAFPEAPERGVVAVTLEEAAPGDWLVSRDAVQEAVGRYAIRYAETSSRGLVEVAPGLAIDIQIREGLRYVLLEEGRDPGFVVHGEGEIEAIEAWFGIGGAAARAPE